MQVIICLCVKGIYLSSIQQDAKRREKPVTYRNKSLKKRHKQNYRIQNFVALTRALKKGGGGSVVTNLQRFYSY